MATNDQDAIGGACGEGDGEVRSKRRVVYGREEMLEKVR